MINLEQLRAGHALEALGKYRNLRGKKEGDALSGFPALVVNNGLLAALAFAWKQGEGYDEIGSAIAEHLKALPMPLCEQTSLESFINELTRQDSQRLRMCTAETLSYLNYLRRFHKAGAPAS